MRYWKWQQGRQGTGYDVMLLAESKRFKFDIYLIRMAEGISVPYHNDPVEDGFEHHRLNISLSVPSIGGYTLINSGLQQEGAAPPKMHLEERRAYHFRPDLYHHMVSRIVKGKLLLLSIGWLRKSK